MTNGLIFVFTQLTGLANVANAGQLSIIIRHELAHCLLRQSDNNYNIVNLAVQVLFVLPITAILTAVLPVGQELFAVMLCQFVLYVDVRLASQRSHEAEADRDGLELAANAYIDGTECYW
jgi:Zn-dependent protease with chaperone function